MSDSLVSALASGGRPVDALSEYQRWQTLGQLQAQTEIAKQQAQQQAIANQAAALKVAPVQFGLSAAGIPNPGGAAGSVLTASSYAPGGAGSQLAEQTADGQPSALSTISTSPRDSSAYPGAAAEKTLGIPMPPLLLAHVLSADDPIRARAEALEVMRTQKQQLFGSVPPAQFPQALDKAVQMGLISPSMAQEAKATPGAQSAILRGLQDPGTYQANALSMASRALKPNPQGEGFVYDPNAGQAAFQLGTAQSAGATQGPVLINQTPSAAAATRNLTTAGQVNQTAEYTVMDDKGVLHTYTAPRDQMENIISQTPGARRASPADQMNPDNVLSLDAYTDRQIGRENGANPNVNQRTSAPGGTASGLGQFTNDSWLDTIKNSNLPWARGMSDAQLLAIKNNPTPDSIQKEREVIGEFAKQNAPILQAAGAGVTSLSLGLAHQWGANGAAAILSAPRNTPISRITTAAGAPVATPQTLANNGLGPNATAADVIGRAAVQNGLNKVDVSGTPQPMPGIPSGTAFSGTTEPVVRALSDQRSADAPIVQRAQDGVRAAQQSQQTLLQAADLADTASTGSGSPWRQSLINWANTYIPGDAKQPLLQALDDKASTNAQIIKLLGAVALSQETQYFGGNGGAETLKAISRTNPNTDMPASAIKEMLNRMAVAQQWSIDYGQGLAKYWNQQNDEFTNPTGGVPRYSSISHYQEDFQKAHPPQLYAAATDLLNGKDASEATSKLTKAQRAMAAQVVWSVNPTVPIKGKNGPIYNPNFVPSAPAAPAQQTQ